MISKREIKNIPLSGNIDFRQKKIEKDHSALLIVDLQKAEYNKKNILDKPNDKYMWERIKNIVIPNGQKLIKACRENKIEIIYTVIESLTIDGRDSGLDYKISGLCIAKNSTDALISF